MKFQKLTPVDTAEISVYEEAINFVFENQDIKNVAVSGAYSAGKSSVIESYKKKNKEKRFLHISLAHFEDVVKVPEGKNILEGKILNQLVHQIDPQKIPQTNFRIKRVVSQSDTVVQTIIAIVLLLIVIYHLKFDEWKVFVDELSCLSVLLSWSTNHVSLLLFTIIGLGLLGYILYSLILMQKSKNIIKKLNVNGNEIEIFEQCNDSYFDKYLNEVLYLFENANADVIVFEDMDRYNSNQIFQRLREINTLVNNRRCKNGKQPLRFFYLIRDDIFVSKDRTKFFDFIIPIIPVLDGSNACDQFIEHFRLGGIIELFDKHFLQDISLYVDDMRILKNVYNEFQIYNARISTTEQDLNKLLAMIVYKNIFPKDFADLQLGMGFVHCLFASKSTFVKRKRDSLKEKIVEYNNRITQMEKEFLKSKAEIEEFYSASKYKDYYGHIKEAYVQEKKTRIENVELYNNNGIEAIKTSIRETEEQIQRIEKMKLSEIIDRDNLDEIFKTCYVNELGETEEFKEIKGSSYFDLLKFLVRNGFIDESYQDYMTYFYENSLSSGDKKFLRSVVDKKAKEYIYTLKNPQMIVERLREIDFENEEILNFDLIDFILSDRDRYNKQIENVVSQLQNERNYDFVIAFIEANREGEKLIKVICRQWVSFFENVLYESRYNMMQKKKVALLILYALNREELTKVNSDGVLTSFISDQTEFLKIDEPRIECIIDKLILLNVKFRDLNIQVSNEELWERVYENDLYELNWGMAQKILKVQYKYEMTEENNKKIATLIFSKPKEPLVAYVKANMNQFVNEVLGYHQDKITDDENAVLHILNDRTLDKEYKVEYISKLSTKINSLESVEDVLLWQDLIDNEIIVYSEKNILGYFFAKEKKYDDSLIKFVNKYVTSFSIEDSIIEQEYGEGASSAFFTATVLCAGMDDDKYEIILRAMGRYYEEFSYKNISPEKIKILIKLKVIQMSSGGLLFMRKNYPNQVADYIKENCEEYVESTIDEKNFLLDEVLELLNTEIEIKYKLRLLEYTGEPISIINQNYDEQVQEYILKNNFCKDDLRNLLQNFDKLPFLLKTKVESLTKENLEEICENEYPMSYELLMRVIKDISVENNKRLELVSFSVHMMSDIQCKECFQALGAIEWVGLFDGKRPKFEISEINERILDVFQNNGWISKYEVEDAEYYRAIGLKR